MEPSVFGFEFAPKLGMLCHCPSPLGAPRRRILRSTCGVTADPIGPCLPIAIWCPNASGVMLTGHKRRREDESAEQPAIVRLQYEGLPP
jgi:hypothetical protein